MASSCHWYRWRMFIKQTLRSEISVWLEAVSWLRMPRTHTVVMVLFTPSPSEPSKPLAFPYLLIVFSIPFIHLLANLSGGCWCDAAPSSPPVISWENLGVFLRCELPESEVLPCSSGDMLAGLLCPLTWFRRLQRQSKATSTTEKRVRFERKWQIRRRREERDWFWLQIKCM